VRFDSMEWVLFEDMVEKTSSTKAIVAEEVRLD
jgi:hypothetical protein